MLCFMMGFMNLVPLTSLLDDLILNLIFAYLIRCLFKGVGFVSCRHLFCHIFHHLPQHNVSNLAQWSVSAFLAVYLNIMAMVKMSALSRQISDLSRARLTPALNASQLADAVQISIFSGK